MEHFVLHAGWLIDGTGGPIQSDIFLEIEGGTICALRHSRERIDRALPLLDHSGSTVVPGLVDSHVHLTMSGTLDPTVRQRQLGYNYEEAKTVIAENLHAHLAHGIVATRDGGDAGGHTGRYRQEFPNGPPILLAAGRAWRSRGRYGRMIGRPPAEGSTLEQELAGAPLRHPHIKVLNSGLNSLKEFGRETAPQFEAEALTAAFRTARRFGQRIMVHANGHLPVRIAIDAGCHSIEHGYFMGPENLKRMADLQVFWVPTACPMKALAVQLPQGVEAEIAQRTLDHQLEQMARARELGVPVATGTDSGGFGVDHGISLGEELSLFLEAGYSLPEAIGCASVEGARLLGIDSIVGPLQRGRAATFSVVPGDPAALPGALSRVSMICIQGRCLPTQDRPTYSPKSP